jgi:hypothetical protein
LLAYENQSLPIGEGVQRRLAPASGASPKRNLALSA